MLNRFLYWNTYQNPIKALYCTASVYSINTQYNEMSIINQENI